MTAPPPHGERNASEEAAPLILDVKGNSLDDGPGIRSVVFFKGCPLTCVWCHNPESKKAAAELAYDAGACTGCETCLTACEKGALDRNLPGYVDRQACDRCFACAAVCPSGALERVGLERSVDEITASILKDKPFFDTSGGGVTFSGGEPTLFPSFLGRLAESIKRAGVHTLLETCGFFDGERFAALVLPHLDTIYFDLKLFDRAAHRRFCGLPNDVLIDNFLTLADLAHRGAIELLPRIPLVPEITATEANIAAWAEFLARHHWGEVKLLAYNPLWPEKVAKIGEDNSLAGQDGMQTWMPAEEVARLEDVFHRAGIATL